MRFSLEGKICSLVSICVIFSLLFVFLFSSWQAPWVLKYSATLLVVLPPTWWATRKIVSHITSRLKALEDGLRNFQDRDFSISIANKHQDELGAVIDFYNAVGDQLREERQYLYQRELLLDTVIQNSNLSLLLLDAKGRIIYSNYEARKLFNEGKPIQGKFLPDFLPTTPNQLQEIINNGGDGLFNIETENQNHAYHLSRSRFVLNAQEHHLYLIKQLTSTLHKQEIETWKKVIRLISHEINNSLAPISSMAHSGRLMLEQGKTEKLFRVFDTISERSDHLKSFLNDYVSLSKLPTPKMRSVNWNSFIDKLRGSTNFEIHSSVPNQDGYFDPIQLEQALINLVKNSVESGSPKDQIIVTISQKNEFSEIEVSDRGKGMTDKELKNALLPFYSTKPDGSGVGLTLCREIIEAHHGKLSITNRKSGGLSVRLWIPNTHNTND